MKQTMFITAMFIGVVLSCSAVGWTKPGPQDIARLTAAAESGNPKAQAELGDAYYFGFSVKIDGRKAVELWRQAAELKDAHAELRLGEIYGDDGSGNGIGIAHPDGPQAMRWLERAMEHGNPLARCYLGQVYELGYDRMPQDHDKAMKLLNECLAPVRALALNGDPDAELTLAHAYDKGWGGQIDEAEAFKWGLKSARQGFPGGETYVALSYYSGAGVEKNLAQSAKWLSDAADKGESFAQLWLGFFYAKGEGVPKDSIKAYIWLDLALIQGLKQAAAPLIEVSKSLTPDQLEEAHNLSHAWQVQHLASR
jgi:uncharacterized protein